jgi:hypothetical protein
VAPSIRQILEWFASGQHRLIAAAILFAVMYALKLIPKVEQRVLTTPQRRLGAVVFLAMAPAVSLLAAGAPAIDVLESAIVIGLGAMGIHVSAKVVRGSPIGVQESKEAEPPKDPRS